VRVVDACGSNGGVVMAACCYPLTLACIVAALIVERTSRRLEPLPQTAG
jgi:hypothetical protein